MLSITFSLAVTLALGSMPALAALVCDMAQPSLAEQYWRAGYTRDLLRRFP